jgi:hypothetical protein
MLFLKTYLPKVVNLVISELYYKSVYTVAASLISYIFFYFNKKIITIEREK